ncbi:hypothetical protein [Streptomyces sp. NPDC017520]|uniref:hypothetical protein n=1 Tax=Streptomyces sp. NPDC017520 TaxID=3364998 RepID=UPI003792D81B
MELNSEQTRAFVASTLPPLMTGHWLMRQDQTAADGTWTHVVGAVTWLKSMYEAPPLRGTGARLAAIKLLLRSVGIQSAFPSQAIW